MAARKTRSGVPVMPAQPRPHIQCCFQNCPNPANVRLWTATGWANVCAYVGLGDRATFHYTKVERVPRIVSSPFVDECRAAFAKSRAASHLPKNQVGKLLKDRVPGEDDA
jgi:hypothetical protein